MSITEACKDKTELNQLCATLLDLAFAEIRENGINPLLVETYRPQARQNYLYAQGRTTAGNKVTWTLNSIHTLRNAVDVVPQRKINGIMTAIWNSSDRDTVKVISIMTKYGFEAGANWSTSTDSPHFQIKGVSTTETEYHSKNTNTLITKMIQKALNDKLGVNIAIDGGWGQKTTDAVNKFRVKNGWIPNGKLGSYALVKLLSK